MLGCDWNRVGDNQDSIDEEGRKSMYRPHGRNRGVRQAQANAKWPLGVLLRNITPVSRMLCPHGCRTLICLSMPMSMYMTVPI